MDIVRGYTDVVDSDRLLIGEKAWAVAQLAQVNIPVPKGFCASSRLTSRILGSDTAFENEYTGYLEGVDKSGLPDQVSAARIRQRIHVAPVDPSILSELCSALRDYIPSRSKTIIVRSSTSIEDSERASFAGQFSSLRTKNNCEALIGAMRKCWEAITSPSLAVYAFAMKVRLTGIGFAFLVQEYLEFEHAGVLFTRDPLRGAIGGYVVEYAEGGAESVVSGRVTPNRCVLKGESEGIKWLRRSSEGRHPSEEVLLELGRLATKCKMLFGAEQDIEWGITGTNVFVLQSRPLTTRIR